MNEIVSFALVIGGIVKSNNAFWLLWTAYTDTTRTYAHPLSRYLARTLVGLSIELVRTQMS